MITAKNTIHGIDIYSENVKIEGLEWLVKYPLVMAKQIMESKSVKVSTFNRIFKSYRDDDRFENHWFYHRSKPVGYFLTLDLFIIILEDMKCHTDFISDFRKEREKWVK